MIDIPEVLKAYIPPEWLDRQASLPPLDRSILGAVLTEPSYSKALDLLLGWIRDLETVIEHNPGIPIKRERIGAELTSTNTRNMMSLAAELDELSYLLPRARTLRYYHDLPRPDFEADLAGREISIEVTTLRETSRSEAEEKLRDELDRSLFAIPSGYLITIDFRRGHFDKAMRLELEAELRTRISAKPALTVRDEQEVTVHDRGRVKHVLQVTMTPGLARQTATLVSHANWKGYDSDRSRLIVRALKNKRTKFAGPGPNVLVLDGTIDYPPFRVSNFLRGHVQWAMIPVPEKGILVPAGIRRGKDPRFRFYPELAAVVFKPHARPLPERLLYRNEHLGSIGVPLTSKEAEILGTVGDEYGY